MIQHFCFCCSVCRELTLLSGSRVCEFVNVGDGPSRDVSRTALSSLPLQVLGNLTRLTAKSAFQLKELPPVQLFSSLLEAHFTYHSHCCPFLPVRRNA